MDNRPHLVERALERYGLVLTDADFDAIDEQIRTAPILARCQDGGETRLVKVRGVVMKAVWWPKLERLATFLPRDSHALTGKRVGPPKDMGDAGHHGRMKARRLGRAFS